MNIYFAIAAPVFFVLGAGFSALIAYPMCYGWKKLPWGWYVILILWMGLMCFAITGLQFGIDFIQLFTAPPKLR